MIEVEVEEDGWRTLEDVEAIVLCAAGAALASASLSRSGRGSGQDDVTVLLADDACVQDLNARFRGKAAPTNVLSFPAPASAAPHLGDIALAYGVCAREAATQDKPLTEHLSHLVVHGVLHLLGYDHTVDAEAEGMEATERAILATLGIADPYRLDPARVGS